jgi:hypothetical protein
VKEVLMNLLTSLVSLLLAFPAFAQEKPKPNLPGTLVVRFHNETKTMEIYESKDKLEPKENSALLDKAFKAVEARKAVNELDKDSSTDSGYGYYGNRWGYYGGYAGAYYNWGFNYYYAPTYYPYYNTYPYYNYYPSYYCCSANYYYGGYAYNYAPYYYYPSGGYTYYYYGYRY